MSKWTRGTWYVSDDEQGGTFIISDEGVRIARVIGQQGNPVHDANADLLAAAKQVVEALRDFVSAYDADDIIRMADVCRSKARAALAKAGVIANDNRDPDIRQGRYADCKNGPVVS